MAKRYYEKDGNLDLLKCRTVAIIGYGSQGHAHALNLRDSGVDVVVGLYPGSKSRAKAEAAGLKVANTAGAAQAADMIMILVSDHIQADLYEKEIAPHLWGTPGVGAPQDLVEVAKSHLVLKAQLLQGSNLFEQACDVIYNGGAIVTGSNQLYANSRDAQGFCRPSGHG